MGPLRDYIRSTESNRDHHQTTAIELTLIDYRKMNHPRGELGLT